MSHPSSAGTGTRCVVARTVSPGFGIAYSALVSSKWKFDPSKIKSTLGLVWLLSKPADQERGQPTAEPSSEQSSRCESSTSLMEILLSDIITKTCYKGGTEFQLLRKKMLINNYFLSSAFEDYKAYVSSCGFFTEQASQVLTRCSHGLSTSITPMFILCPLTAEKGS